LPAGVVFVYVALMDVAVCDAGRWRLGNLVLSCIKQKKRPLNYMNWIKSGYRPNGRLYSKRQ